MKKLLAMLLVLTMVLASAFAVVNDQKVYSVTDDVFSNIETLYIASGYGLPSSSGPWTANELIHMMDKIDREALAPIYQTVYDSVMKTLNPTADFEFDTVSLDFGMDINLEAYLRSNAAKDGQAYLDDIYGCIDVLKAEVNSLIGDRTKETVNTEGFGVWTAKFVNSKAFSIGSIRNKYDDLVAKCSAIATSGIVTEEIEDYLERLKKPTDIASFAANVEAIIGLGVSDEIESQYQLFIGTRGDSIDNRYNGYSEWFHGEDSRNPLLTLRAETWAAKNFYGYFEFAFGDSPWGYQYQKKVNKNFNFLTTYEVAGTTVPRFATLSWNTPQKAIATVGGDHWSLIAGRDKLSWGAGESGNLMLSKSFDYHTFAQFSTYHNVFNYTLLATYYPYYGSVYKGDYNCGQDGDSQDGFKSLIAHRLEFSMFKNKVNFAVTESLMIRKLKDEAFNIAMINPFGFMHNEYTRTNSNSMLVFEADYTPFKGVNVYGQFALDDFSIPGQSDDVVPDANGFMLGLKGTKAFDHGVLTLNGEYTKTSPYLYLRGIYEEQDEYGAGNELSYGLGYDAVTRYFNSMCAVTFHNDFVTYTYGNDMIVLNLKANYDMPNLINVGFEFNSLTSGVMDINSPWGQGDHEDPHEIVVNYDTTTPSTVDPFYNGSYNEQKTGAIERTNILTFTVSYQTPVKGLSLSAIADVIATKNWNNIEGATFNDVQVTIGAKYAL